MVKTDALTEAPLRDVRQGTVERIKQRITESGFKAGKPIICVEKDGKLVIADGNHRYQAAKALGLKEVPVLVSQDDLYTIATSYNTDEDVYATMDVFDWNQIIQTLKSRGLTQEQIAARIGWSREKVKDYAAIGTKLGAEFLKVAKSIQTGRASGDGATAPTFNFTEGWLRNSGLYNLSPDYQTEFLTWAISQKFPSPKAMSMKLEALTDIQAQLAIIKEKLSPEVDGTALTEAVKKHEYTEKRLLEVIERLNLGAKNRAVYGVDCLSELKKMQSASCDLLISDVPFGVSYQAAWNKNLPSFDKGITATLEMLEPRLKEAARVLKPTSHVYIFFPASHYTKFRELLERCFAWVDPIPLCWSKNHFTPRDFRLGWARSYEPIFFATMERGAERKLNYEASSNVLNYAIPPGLGRIHSCQKPVDLLEYLIGDSTATGETILDPFCGSGSALVAAKKSGRFYVGFEQEKAYEADFKRWIGEF
jgi:site-specific DNA-methyltransferase (adenine-specific)